MPLETELDRAAVSAAMRALELDPAALAACCKTTPDDVSRWLAGEGSPTPAQLLKLGRALGLSYHALTGRVPLPEPEVVLVPNRARVAATVIEQATERVLEAHHYAQALRAHLPDPGWTRPRLLAPSVTPEYVAQTAQALRLSLRATPGARDAFGVVPGVLPLDATCGPQEGPLWIAEAAQLLAGSHVLLVPVLGLPGDAEGGQPGVAGALVRDVEHDRCTAFINVSLPHAAGSHALSVLYGTALAMPALEAQQALSFGQALAADLVGTPQSVRRSTRRSRDHLLADALGMADGPLAFIRAVKRELRTPVFEAFDAYQRAQGGRDHAAMMRLTQSGAAGGWELTGALWFAERWSEMARQARNAA